MAFNGKKADPFRHGDAKRKPGLGVRPVKKAAAKKPAAKKSGGKKGGK